MPATRPARSKVASEKAKNRMPRSVRGQTERGAKAASRAGRRSGGAGLLGAAGPPAEVAGLTHQRLQLVQPAPEDRHQVRRAVHAVEQVQDLVDRALDGLGALRGDPPE